MCKGFEQKFLRRRYKKQIYEKVHKKMFTIINHEKKNKTFMTYHFTSIKMVIIKITRSKQTNEKMLVRL